MGAGWVLCDVVPSEADALLDRLLADTVGVVAHADLAGMVVRAGLHDAVEAAKRGADRLLAALAGHALHLKHLLDGHAGPSSSLSVKWRRRRVRRDNTSAVTTPARSPDSRVMSEASMATSVPVPMAMPRSAWTRAGASLIPSPTMATTLPSCCSRRTSATLSSGRTSAR